MRYVFSTFRAKEDNQAALDVCRSVAGLEAIERFPVVLVGESGVGKTHLLYSIVNHVRSHHPQTGLAFVRAGQFPQEVQELIQNPEPLSRVNSAILLVDQLDAFTEQTQSLEALTRLFLDHGHRVVMASSLHPEELLNVSDTFKNLLGTGRTVEIGAQHDRVKQPFLSDLVREQKEENQRLRCELLAAKEAAEVATKRAALVEEKAQQELDEAIQSEQAEMVQAVALAKEEVIRKSALDKAQAVGKIESEKKELQRELEQARATVVELKCQVHGENEKNTYLNQQIVQSNNESATLRRERDEAQTELKNVEAKLLETTSHFEAELERGRLIVSELTDEYARVERDAQVRENDLATDLAEARAQLDRANQERDDLIARLQGLAAKIEKQAAAFAAARASEAQDLERLEEMVRLLSERSHQNAMTSETHHTGRVPSEEQNNSSGAAGLQAENVSIFPDRGQVA